MLTTPQHIGRENALLILQFIRTYFEDNKKTPTRKEIQQVFQCSYQAVVTNLHRLQDMGYIKLIPNIARNIRLTMDED